MMTELFDPGLQPERTLLAWRRTILAVAVAGLVGLRLLPMTLGVWSLPLPLILLMAAVALHMASERRLRRVYSALTATRPLPSAGPLTLALTVLVSVCALTGIASVLLLADQAPNVVNTEGWHP
ncbi:DUF202 domain-containing protein [Microbacterium sp. ZW CA_36]|uniref:DUF202 domain-containing protein n=1 Tax=Microbacterium sp. ZW CA_36 TaxID=3378078 RepID=UPI0038552BB0